MLKEEKDNIQGNKSSTPVFRVGISSTFLIVILEVEKRMRPMARITERK